MKRAIGSSVPMAATVRLWPCFAAAIHMKDFDHSTLDRVAEV